MRKQFVGAPVCSLMLANGYSKTGRKRAIPQPDCRNGAVRTPPEGGTGLVLEAIGAV